MYRRGVAAAAAAAAAGSFVATAVVVSGDPPLPVAGQLVGFVEVAGLLVLLALVVRWSPPVAAVLAGGATSAAVAAWILRVLPSLEPAAIIGGAASMGVPMVFAVVIGGYGRLAAAKLVWSVRSARQAQRLDLAHDLHDYVAHDVTAIVAQAQAARYALADDPVRLAATLERIEAIGAQTLTAMDHMLALLSDNPATPTRPLPGMADLAEVVARFRDERPSCVVESTVDTRAAAAPPQVCATVHRIVTEALTNVRRHAPAATRVTVAVRMRGDRLAVHVTDDGNRRAWPRQVAARAARGSGLTGLRERVRALGGELAAGRDDAGQWVLRAAIPLSPI